jgi:membrane protein required for colicin V production
MMEILSTIGVADVVAILIVLFAAFHGLHRGLSGELSQVVGIVAAIVVAFVAFNPLGAYLMDEFELSPTIARISALVGTMMLSMLVMAVIVSTLKRLLEIVIGDRLDRAMGFVAGVLRAAVIVAILFLVMNVLPSRKLNYMFGEGSYVGCAAIHYLPFLREHTEEP